MGIVTNTAHHAQRRRQQLTPDPLTGTGREIPGWRGVEGGCKDIARQLIEDNPDIKVSMWGWVGEGGGRGGEGVLVYV